jgi:hypothetical protein
MVNKIITFLKSVDYLQGTKKDYREHLKVYILNNSFYVSIIYINIKMFQFFYITIERIVFCMNLYFDCNHS